MKLITLKKLAENVYLRLTQTTQKTFRQLLETQKITNIVGILTETKHYRNKLFENDYDKTIKGSPSRNCSATSFNWNNSTI